MRKLLFTKVIADSFFPLAGWQGFKDFIPYVGTDSVDMEDLLPFSGCVVQKGVKKMAVYKDGNGVLHQYSGYLIIVFVIVESKSFALYNRDQ